MPRIYRNRAVVAGLRSILPTVVNDESKHVFVSYVREDAEKVDQLCQALEAANIPYWRDRDSLAPGDDWRRRIRDAIRSGALVFLACFSRNSLAKTKSYMNEELHLAVEEFRRLPPDATWLMPVRFDNVDVPEWELGSNRTLRDFNYADLFGDRYVRNLVALTNRISKVMGADVAPLPAALTASIAGVGATERSSMMWRMTNEMLLDPVRRIELDNLVAQETRRILAAMRDEKQFPVRGLAGNSEDELVRCAKIAMSYWRLIKPFCASLQVATQWSVSRGLNPWVSGLNAIANEAARRADATAGSVGLEWIPVLISTFTATLAAARQNRWDNLAVLLANPQVMRGYRAGFEALTHVGDVWAPFGARSDWNPSVLEIVAYAAKNSYDETSAYKVLQQSNRSLPTPAEWLYALLRHPFVSQYGDERAFDADFDRAEIMLGLLALDFVMVQGGSSSGRTIEWRPGWSSDTKRRHTALALRGIAREVEIEKTSWAPLAFGLFGGRIERVTAALEAYTGSASNLDPPF